MTVRRRFDVVCVGSGVGGAAAALSAASLGLRVCLVERGEKLGGGSAYSLGALWVGANHLQAARGIEDSLEDTRAYLEFLAGGAAIAENLETYVREGPRALRAYERMGVGVRIIENVPDHYYPSAPGSKPAGRSLEAVPISRRELGPWADLLQQGPYAPPGMTWSDAVAWGGFANRKGWDWAALEARARDGLTGAGQGIVTQLLAGLVRRKVTILNRFRAESLVVRGGRVDWVRGSHDGEEWVLGARRGVVLATGGYEGDPELVERLEGVPDWHSMFPETVDGDGYRMGAEVGAAIYRVPTSLCLLLGYLIPGAGPGGSTAFRNGGGPREFTYPHCFIVNRDGRRFADESQFQHLVPELRAFDAATHRYRNLPCYLIFDRQYVTRYSFAGREPGAGMPEWAPQSDSIEGLAGQLGIDPQGLAETTRRFNEGAARGEDPEFGRGRSEWSRRSGGDHGHAVHPNLGPVAEPPFGGVRLYPTGTPSAGLLTNEYGGVVHVRGHAIPGLYATGNTAAPSDFGVGYQAGLTLMRGMTFGLLAAEHAARQNRP